MDSYGLNFHHLGLACRDENRALRFLYGLGYRISDQIEDPVQNVRLRLCESASFPSVELIIPGSASDPKPLERILTDSDALIYHSCFQTENTEASLNKIREAGNRIICVSQPKPAVLFDGNYVSFYLVRGFGLIELLETE